MLKNSTLRYGIIAKLLHWSIALLIIGLIWLGWYMVDLTYYDVWYYDSLFYHKALGILVLALAALKILWALGNRSPDHAATIPAWQVASARTVHKLLYLLMVLIPVTGYIISTSAGDAIEFFAGVEIPVLLAPNETLRDWAITGHYYLAYGVGGVALLHALAALKHQFIDRDGTLRKML